MSRDGYGLQVDQRYLSDPDMVAAQLVEQEYLQALGKYIFFKMIAWK